MADLNWYIGINGLTHEYLPDAIEGLTKPYPLIAWRIDHTTNGGMPFHDFLPLPISLTINRTLQRKYITVYDSLSKIEDFETHGLAVLSPISCEITEEYAGRYSLALTHPKDSSGKWKHLKQFNIIKAMEQLFYIVSLSESKDRVSVVADHVFYMLNDRWLFPNSIAYSNSVMGVLAVGWNSSVDHSSPEQMPRIFGFDSDITDQSFEYAARKFMKIADGMSYAELVMGSGNVLDLSGGELYRDNFYFSINKRMENSNNEAFEIRVGKDLTGIKRNVDTSQMCTEFRAYYGNDSTRQTWFAVSYHEDTVKIIAPHSIVRSQVFNVERIGTPTEEAWYAYEDAIVTKQALKFFDENCVPKVTFEINLEDVNDNPDYAEFSNLPDYRVGNIGKVYDERLGIDINLMIIKTVKDAIRGKTKSITVTSRFSGEIATSAFKTKDGAYFKTADGKKFTTKIGG